MSSSEATSTTDADARKKKTSHSPIRRRECPGNESSKATKTTVVDPPNELMASSSSSSSSSSSLSVSAVAAPSVQLLQKRRPFKKRMRQFRDCRHSDGFDGKDEVPSMRESQSHHQHQGEWTALTTVKESVPTSPAPPPPHEASEQTSLAVVVATGNTKAATSLLSSKNVSSVQDKAQLEGRTIHQEEDRILDENQEQVGEEGTEKTNNEAVIARADSTSSAALAALVTPPRLERQTAAVFPVTIAHTHLLEEQTSCNTIGMGTVSNQFRFVVDLPTDNHNSSFWRRQHLFEAEQPKMMSRTQSARNDFDDVAALDAHLTLFEDCGEPLLLSPLPHQDLHSKRSTATKTSDVCPFPPNREEDRRMLPTHKFVEEEAVIGKESNARLVASSAVIPLSEVPLVVDAASMKRMMMALSNGGATFSGSAPEEGSEVESTGSATASSAKRIDSAASSMDISALEDDHEGDEAMDEISATQTSIQFVQSPPHRRPQSVVSIPKGDPNAVERTPAPWGRAGESQGEDEFGGVLQLITSPILPKRRRARTTGGPDTSRVEKPSSPATTNGSRKSSLASSENSSRVTPSPTRMKMSLENLDDDGTTKNDGTMKKGRRNRRHDSKTSAIKTVDGVDLNNSDDANEDDHHMPISFCSTRAELSPTRGDTQMLMPVARQRSSPSTAGSRKVKIGTLSVVHSGKKAVSAPRSSKSPNDPIRFSSIASSTRHSSRRLHQSNMMTSPAILSQLEEEKLIGAFHGRWNDLNASAPVIESCEKSSLSSIRKTSQEPPSLPPSEVLAPDVLAKVAELGKMDHLTGSEKVNEMQKLLIIPSREEIDNDGRVRIPTEVFGAHGSPSRQHRRSKGGRSSRDKYVATTEKSRRGKGVGSVDSRLTPVAETLEDLEAGNDDERKVTRVETVPLFNLSNFPALGSGITAAAKGTDSDDTIHRSSLLNGFPPSNHGRGNGLRIEELWNKRSQSTSDASIALSQKIASQPTGTSLAMMPPSHPIGPSLHDSAAAFNFVRGSDLLQYGGRGAFSNNGSAFSPVDSYRHSSYQRPSKADYERHFVRYPIEPYPGLTHGRHYHPNMSNQCFNSDNVWDHSFLLATTDPLDSSAISTNSGAYLDSRRLSSSIPNNRGNSKNNTMNCYSSPAPYWNDIMMSLSSSSSPSAKAIRRVSDPNEEEFNHK